MPEERGTFFNVVGWEIYIISFKEKRWFAIRIPENEWFNESKLFANKSQEISTLLWTKW